jgi:hypothetical protein
MKINENHSTCVGHREKREEEPRTLYHGHAVAFEFAESSTSSCLKSKRPVVEQALETTALIG